MGQAITRIPVDHHAAVHEIELQPTDEPRKLTLLELIKAVSEVSDDEDEVVATVTYMLHSGRVRLAGNFRDMPVDEICAAALCG